MKTRKLRACATAGLLALAVSAALHSDNRCAARGALVHDWKLDETTGAVAIDAVGSANATLGGSSAWTAGKLNNAFKTSGPSLGYANAGNVTISGAFSLSFWVKPEDVSLDWRNVVSKHDGAAGSKSLWIGQGAADGSLRFGMYFDGTTESSIDTPASMLANNAWSLVTATWNEATRTQSIYVNGILRASAIRSAGASFLTPRSSNLLFNTNATTAAAGAGTGSWARFAGAVDDVAIWDKAMPSGDVLAMYNAAYTPGLGAFDAQAFAVVRAAYETNFSASVGNVRWSRVAAGLNIGEGAVQARPNGFLMQLDSSGAGVSALSTIHLSFDPIHQNLADTSSASENPGGSGPDQPAIRLGAGGLSEIDGLTANSSIGSADVRPDDALNGTVFVMLWLVDINGTDDRAALRTELAGAGGSVYSVLNANDSQWQSLAQTYAGFDTLVRFDDASLVGAINWDFATHTDIVVDQVAACLVPEPTCGLVAPAGIAAMGRRSRSAR